MPWLLNPASGARHFFDDAKAAIYTSASRPVAVRWTVTTAPPDGYTPPVVTPVTSDQLTAALATKANLSGGKLAVSELPPLAIADYLGPATNQTQMLALVGQRGDWCTRTDTGTTWLIIGDTPSSLSSWQQLSYPAMKLASATDLDQTGAATGRVPAVTGLTGGAPSGYGLRAVAPLLTKTATKTSAYTAAAGELVVADTTAGTFVITVPAVAAAGDPAQVGVRWDAGTVAPTVQASGTDKFGTGTATTATDLLPGETRIWQNEPGAGRWRALVDNKPQGTLDSRAAAARVLSAWTARRQANWERDNAPGFDVFIDSVNGSDSNTGASPTQAYATLGKLTTVGVAAGTRIGLARGSTFSAAFTVPTVTGTLSRSNRVTFGSYGVGALPKVTATFTIAQPHIDVQDIRFTGTSTSYNLFIFNGTTTCISNQVRRCELDTQTGSGALIMGVIGGLVEDCYFHDVWNNAEYPSGNGFAALFTTGSDGTEIRYNTVRNCYKGLGSANTHRNLLIHHNIVDKCRVNGIDMQAGTVGAPPRIISNFVWHRPTTPNGHGIDTQTGTVGPVWRNNIVYCDYDGTAGNVELYCIDSTTLPNTDVDYNLGFIKAGTSGASYGKLGTSSLYSTLAAFQTALAATSYAGKEAHSVQADPLLADLAGGVFVPATNGPAANAGVAVPGVIEAFLGSAPDLGVYEVV